MWTLIAAMRLKQHWQTSLAAVWPSAERAAADIDRLGRNLAMAGALCAAHVNSMSQTTRLLSHDLRGGVPDTWSPGCGRPVRRDDLVGEAV